MGGCATSRCRMHRAAALKDTTRTMSNRLTLRKLIAYCCGMVDGRTSRMIASRIEETPHLQRIQQRIETLLATKVAKAGSYKELSRHYLDPNFTAAYLSNDLHGAMLLRFEQHCLKWDTVLEETTACNMILAEVFADPPSDPDQHASLRARLYALGKSTTGKETE